MIRYVWSCVSYMSSVLFYEGHAMFKSLIEKKSCKTPNWFGGRSEGLSCCLNRPLLISQGLFHCLFGYLTGEVDM